MVNIIRTSVPLSTCRRTSQALQYLEPLSNTLNLEMVFIPGGTFLMGSPSTELGHRQSEEPQHSVTIQPFFMGKYPITQAQYQAVMRKNPSRFKDKDKANHPVENVSWRDAQTFCQRLSDKTKRSYSLPSEAEWEYACRARTTTPFHFGETITTDWANYRGTDWQIGETTYPGDYGVGPKGEYRQQTTPVGHFAYANAFGLYDMHGNVWEWCADHWHASYDNPPTDGSAWLEQDDNDNRSHVLRGGSWYDNPVSCRSACRDSCDFAYYICGFRVVCRA